MSGWMDVTQLLALHCLPMLAGLAADYDWKHVICKHKALSKPARPRRIWYTINYIFYLTVWVFDRVIQWRYMDGYRRSCLFRSAQSSQGHRRNMSKELMRCTTTEQQK